MQSVTGKFTEIAFAPQVSLKVNLQSAVYCQVVVEVLTPALVVSVAQLH